MSSKMSRFVSTRARQLSSASLAVALLISAPAQCQDGNAWDAAHARLLAQAPGTMQGAVADWRVLESSLLNSWQPRFDSIAGFLLRYPGFPDETKLRLSAEKALTTEQVDAGRLIAFFDRFPPLTNPARARYALALAAYSRPEAADMARAAWRGGPMSPSDASAIYARWGAGFTPSDHDARLDALLWAGDGAAAGALRCASPAAAQLGAARLSLQQGTNPESPVLSAFIASTALPTTPPAADANPATTCSAQRQAPFAPHSFSGIRIPSESILRADPGYLLDRVRFLTRQGRSSEAASTLANHPALTHPALDPRKWVAVLLAAARASGAEGAAGIAEHMKEGLGANADISTMPFAIRDDATSLLWLGGTSALWRLGDNARAARLFMAYAAAARTPQTRAKGYYWAGRASGGEAGERNFAFAAQYPDQYYGLLALERLGQPIPPLGDPPHPQPTPAQRAAFEGKPLTQAVREVARNAEWTTTIRFFREIAEQARTETDEVLVADLARQLGRRDLGVIIGTSASNNGDPGFRSVEFPLAAVPQGADWTWVHAISRQESQFSQNALSHTGARGLMQLEPGTAAEQAHKLGLGYSQSALTDDPQFNMQLGNAYFQHLLGVFGGSYPLAVAAYNAGAGNVGKWLRAYGDPRTGAVDWTEWVEHIPLTETRTYVQHVMENAVVYEALYPNHAAYHGPNPLSYYMGKRRPG